MANIQLLYFCFICIEYISVCLYTHVSFCKRYLWYSVLLRCAHPAVRGTSVTFWCRKMRPAPFSPRRLLWWAGAGGLTSQRRATSLWPSSSSSLLEVVKGQLKPDKTLMMQPLVQQWCLKWKRSCLPFLTIFSFSNLFIVLACCCFTMQCNIHHIFSFLLILTYLWILLSFFLYNKYNVHRELCSVLISWISKGDFLKNIYFLD